MQAADTTREEYDETLAAANPLVAANPNMKRGKGQVGAWRARLVGREIPKNKRLIFPLIVAS
jgi:hypothetical protein